jgi:hypothetical protein
MPWAVCRGFVLKQNQCDLLILFMAVYDPLGVELDMSEPISQAGPFPLQFL